MMAPHLVLVLVDSLFSLYLLEVNVSGITGTSGAPLGGRRCRTVRLSLVYFRPISSQSQQQSAQLAHNIGGQNL